MANNPGGPDGLATGLMATASLLGNLAGERIQNCQNEDEALDLTFNCAKIKDKVSVTWELKPIEPRRSLLASASEPLPRGAIRLVVVIDISHSMAEPYGPDESVSKLDKIKLFAQLLIGAMPDDDYLGIVTFGTKAQSVFPLSKMSEDNKDKAASAIEAITLGGVTNLGAGLMSAIDLFKSPYSKSRYYNDNVMLFTDGMANEGMVETDDMIREMRKKIQILKKDCHFADDYTVKLTTLGTGGFLPELIYHLGQAFSSDAFYFLEESTNLELNLMKPVLMRDSALVSSVNVNLVALNGVLLDKDEMTNEYEAYNDGTQIFDESKAHYCIHDIAGDMQRHLVCILRLPPKHKKTLKNKDIMTLHVKYRDRNLMVRTVEKTINYTDLPQKENKTLEKDVVIASEHEARLSAQKSLNRAADYMKKLERANAKNSIQYGASYIRDYCDYVSTLISEESNEYLLHKVDPMLANLEYCDRFLGDLSVRWDDAWARLKAMSSSLGREVPTAAGVYLEGAELFVPPKVDEKMDSLCSRLRDMYIALGMSTETIDRYKTVMRELQEKLEKLEEEGGDFKETRI